MIKPLIAGNWKMHGSQADNQQLLDALLAGDWPKNNLDCGVCVPAIYLDQVAKQLQGSAIAWAGQDVSAHDKGAYTGEISAAMLADLGCRYVLVGHSERRQYHQESHDEVAAKWQAARRQGLTPVLCIGETEQQQAQGQTETVLAEQLNAILAQATTDDLAQSVIAYEPVWAIGTGKTASPEQAQSAHAFIRSQVQLKDATIAAQIRIIYGGSVNADNAKTLLAMPDINGGLVGGASLKADQFLRILNSI